ncbi:MAG: cobalt ECF transporter T component CbiQ [Actinomycetota bacterium]
MSTAPACLDHGPILAAPVARGMVARLDPRTRVVVALLFAVAVVTDARLDVLGGLLGMAAVLAVLARLAPGPTLRRLLALEGFMLLVLAMLPFTVPGRVVAEPLGLAATAEGLARAGAIVLKANAVALATLALVGSLEPVVLGRALARLGAPERLVHLLLFTVRYVDVLADEYRRLRLAMRARAFRPRAGLHTWCSLGCLFGMLMVRSAERAERIHAAMRLRGFTGRFHLLDDGAPGVLDWGVGAASVAALAVLALPW